MNVPKGPKGPKSCPNEGKNGGRCTYRNCGNLHVNLSSKAYILPVGGGKVESGDEILVCKPTNSTKSCTTCKKEVFGLFLEHNKTCSGKTTKPVVCNHCNEELNQSWGEHKRTCLKWPKFNVFAKEFISSNTDIMNDAFISYSDDEEEEEYHEDNNTDEIEHILFKDDDEDDEFVTDFEEGNYKKELLGTWIPKCRKCRECLGFYFGRDVYQVCSQCNINYDFNK
jgi:hypothetical protein